MFRCFTINLKIMLYFIIQIQLTMKIVGSVVKNASA